VWLAFCHFQLPRCFACLRPFSDHVGLKKSSMKYIKTKKSIKRNQDSSFFLHNSIEAPCFSSTIFRILLFLLFLSKILQAVSLTFSALKLANSRNSFLISTTDFEKAASYFFTSSPVFLKAYVLRLRTLFSPVENSFTAISFRSFRNNFLFRFVPSQKAITPNLVAAGRCSMNSDKNWILILRWLLEKKLCCQRSTGIFCVCPAWAWTYEVKVIYGRIYLIYLVE